MELCTAGGFVGLSAANEPPAKLTVPATLQTCQMDDRVGNLGCSVGDMSGYSEDTAMRRMKRRLEGSERMLSL
ncbi:hypothetical protein MHYP_G00325280 [Metynnis hypsauchen]